MKILFKAKQKIRIIQMIDRSIGRSAVELSLHVPVLMTYVCCSRDSNTKHSIWGAKALTNCAIPAIWQYDIARNSKRSMGHIAHLRNQYKSINTFAQSYDYIMTLIWSGKIDHLLLDNWIFLICKTFSPLHQRLLCVKFHWNWLSGSWEENFCQYIFAIL